MQLIITTTKVAFFRILKNGGNSGASFEDRTKRFFGSDSKMVGPVSHVSSSKNRSNFKFGAKNEK